MNAGYCIVCQVHEVANEGDPFNCPKCGAHDYGMHAGKCPHCGYDRFASSSTGTLIYRLHDWCNQDFTGKDVVEEAQELMTEAAEALAKPASATGTSQWIPVGERMPRYDQSVWFHDADGEHFGWYDDGEYAPERKDTWQICNAGIDGSPAKANGVTHWMPLPSAPADGGAKP